uniref:Nerve growth factor-related domain-containing protein n=2 Tax=Scophthalmus maximus TaxID=52904 RepID=A0A8D2ZZ98_SCOMX
MSTSLFLGRPIVSRSGTSCQVCSYVVCAGFTGVTCPAVPGREGQQTPVTNERTVRVGVRCGYILDLVMMNGRELRKQRTGTTRCQGLTQASDTGRSDLFLGVCFQLWFRGSRWQARGARPALESGSRVHRGSHFNWTHSTGRVPMRSSPLVLLLLIGVQAVLNMGGGLAQSAGAANHRAGQQTAANQRAGQQQRAAGDQLSEHHSSQEHHRTSHHRTKRHHRAASHSQDRSSVAIHSSSPDPSLPVVDPKLFSKRRYRSSPRVVFSEVPPSHDALEGEGYDIEGVRGVRVRRRAGSHTMHRGEYSVCDSINTWVGNLTRATDIAGNEVTVLPNVTINNVVKKQFFYETTCRYPTHRGSGNANGGRPGVRGGKQGPKSGNSGCLGIDSRHWNSYCTNTHIFVSALTTFKERTAWRFIRINAACVCVLSRKSWAGRLGH